MGVRARALAVLTTLILGGAPSIAHADVLPRLIPRLVTPWLTGHYPRQGQSPAPVDPNAHLSPDSAVPGEWIGSELDVAIVARDWSEAYSVTDGRPLVFDHMRLVRSSRMAVSRFSFAKGRIVPYAELSLGQWRVDPDLMPALPHNPEIAGQVALGFQVRLARRCAIAWDVERTAVDRGDSGPNPVPVSALFGSFAALRAEF